MCDKGLVPSTPLTIVEHRQAILPRYAGFDFSTDQFPVDLDYIDSHIHMGPGKERVNTNQ